MKSVLLFLFFGGILMIVIGYVRQSAVCPAPRIEYRYIPRTFYDEQLSGDSVMKHFQTMFEKETPWIKNRDVDVKVDMNRLKGGAAESTAASQAESAAASSKK